MKTQKRSLYSNHITFLPAGLTIREKHFKLSQRRTSLFILHKKQGEDAIVNCGYSYKYTSNNIIIIKNSTKLVMSIQINKNILEVDVK